MTSSRSPLLSGECLPRFHSPPSSSRMRRACRQSGETNNTASVSACSARPTLDINGLWSGWTGPGPKTIIPAKASVKLSSRLVGNQDPEKIFGLLKDFIKSIAPPTVKVKVSLVTKGDPALIPFDLPEMQAASRAYKEGWGYEPVFTRGGGSIPIVAEIYKLMQIPVIMMGYGLDTDGLHSPNEHYSIEMFQRGIETAIVYLEELAQLPARQSLRD